VTQIRRSLVFAAVATAVATAGLALASLQAQAPPAQRPAQPQAQGQVQQAPSQNPRPQVQVDPERARQLYVSKDPKDHTPGTNYQADIAARERLPPATRNSAKASSTSRW
jgi:hypothetical protein